jgi:hypothetical protein
MNKKLVLPIVLVILILLGGGAYIMSQKSSKAPVPLTAQPASPTATTAPTAASAAEGTLKSLLTSGVPQICTFANKKQATTNGTIYVSGGKMRGDFTSANQGQNITGHIIVDSGNNYIWTDLSNRGMKIALTAEQTGGTANAQSMDLNQTVSYACKPWAPDASKFTLPTDITFSTLTVPQGASGVSVTGATTACDACNSLPAAAQVACKTQLNCK